MTDPTDPYLPKNVLTFQICTIFATLLIAVFGGFLPYFVRASKNVDVIMSYLNCASGGILLGVALLHILPETGETLNELVSDFPLSQTITFCALLLMILLVKIGHNHSHTGNFEALEKQKLLGNEPITENLGDGSHDHGHEGHGHCDHTHTHTHSHNWFSIIMLMLGLFIHDVSEGLAMGFLNSMDSAVPMFIAIALHKWCDVSCQAVVGIREGLDVRKNIYTMIPLVLATPVAQSFSLIVTATVGESDPAFLAITTDVFMSIACGTFLAIAFQEIINQEINVGLTTKQVAGRACCILCGFVIIMLSSIVEAVSGIEE